MYIYYNPKGNEYVDEKNRKIDILGKLKRINILVGENNAGKSRFMRNLISNDDCKIQCNELSTQKQDKLNNTVNYLMEDIRILDGKEYKNLKKTFATEGITNIDKFIEIYKVYKNNDVLMTNQHIKSELESILEDLDIFRKIKNINSIYYIPILRGIENFEIYFKGKDKLQDIQMTLANRESLDAYIDNAKKVYINKVSTIYNISEKKIFTGENLYDEIINILLGEESLRETFHTFEKFIGDSFYDGMRFSINPRKDKNCLMVKIKDDTEYEMYNLGDGIKQLIVLLYPIFMHKDEKCLFFIEEPEINLHPGFQRKFMEILLSDDVKNHIYFINTHSNHIIDIINDSNDVTLYKFKKLKNKKEITTIGNNYVSILNDLGIRSSSIFLSNCTIWVEGVSDRIYLKKYLKLYYKQNNKENIYKENIHYSFVEYQGGNIVHWNFDSETEDDSKINVDWLSRNVFLIADNDNSESKPTSKKNLRLKNFEKILGENFYKLKSREIENLISLPILEKMLMKDNELQNIERKKYNNSRWKKEYTQDILSNPTTYIGEFIEDVYNVKKSYKISNGKTIKNKAEFAMKICEEIKEYDDLTVEAKELTEKVAQFIEKNNSCK